MDQIEKQRLIPLYPFIKAGLLSISQFVAKPQVPAVLDDGVIFSAFNARSALEMGLKSMLLNPGDEVLVPAYHCPVMIYPIIQSGCTPIYYKVNEDCSINLDDFRNKISSNTKAAMAVHYFGFPSHLSDVREICDDRGLFLIEDCAHAFFGYSESSPIGSVGDISVVSLYKFFPVYDGGALRYNNQTLCGRHKKTRHVSLFLQLKSMINTVEVRKDQNETKGIVAKLLRLKDFVWRSIKRQNTDMIAVPVDSTADGPYSADTIAPTYLPYAMPWFSSFIFRFTDRAELSGRRRRNYKKLHEALEKRRDITPLFSELWPAVVPYTFPLISDKADLIAARLRERGVSVGRFGEYYWDDKDRVVCSISNYYSRHCIQIPIHQSLSDEDVDYIIDCLG
jgi:perosamine synthetase